MDEFEEPEVLDFLELVLDELVDLELSDDPDDVFADEVEDDDELFVELEFLEVLEFEEPEPFLLDEFEESEESELPPFKISFSSLSLRFSVSN